HLDAWGDYRFGNELDVSRNRFGFSGHLWDRETNLLYLTARFYDPQTGRFTSQDTFFGETNEPSSLHRFIYSHNRPTRFVDQSGHWVESPWDAASLAIGATALYHDVKQKRWKMAAIDAVGVIADTAALAIPAVPGGVGIAIRASRATELTVKGIQTA